MNLKRRTLGLLTIVSLSAAMCGCTLPSWWASPATVHTPDAVSNWHGTPGYAGKGPDANGDAPMQLPPPRILPMNEQISLMSERVKSAEDDRKVWAGRVQMLETQLEEKEKALAAATREIQESTAQIVRTRNELQQWQKEVKTLRDKCGTMEKENRETLETLIRTLEQYLDAERDPAKGPDVGAPEHLWMPRNK